MFAPFTGNVSGHPESGNSRDHPEPGIRGTRFEDDNNPQTNQNAPIHGSQNQEFTEPDGEMTKHKNTSSKYPKSRILKVPPGLGDHVSSPGSE